VTTVVEVPMAVAVVWVALSLSVVQEASVGGAGGSYNKAVVWRRTGGRRAAEAGVRADHLPVSPSICANIPRLAP
jgi:hypothetical protein